MNELLTFVVLPDAETGRRLGRYCIESDELVLFYRGQENRFKLGRLATKFSQFGPQSGQESQNHESLD